MKKILIAAIMAGLALGASAVPVEYWQFDDANGAALNAVANSGSLNSVWNFGGSGMATDGSGNFVLAGDGGTTTRKLPKQGTANANAGTDTYATPLAGSDTYTLEVNWSAWDYTSATIGDAMNFKALDSTGVLVASISVEKDSATTTRVRMASANANYRNFAYSLTDSSAVSAKIEFNLAGGTSEYFIDGSSTHSFSSQTFAGNIGGLIFTKSGTWSTAGSSASIDSMGLSMVPEPATLGMLGLGALATLLIRRIRGA